MSNLPGSNWDNNRLKTTSVLPFKNVVLIVLTFKNKVWNSTLQYLKPNVRGEKALFVCNDNLYFLLVMNKVVCMIRCFYWNSEAEKVTIISSFSSVFLKIFLRLIGNDWSVQRLPFETYASEFKQLTKCFTGIQWNKKMPLDKVFTILNVTKETIIN